MKKRRLSNLLGFTLLMASFFASCQVGVNNPSTPDSTKTGVITGRVIYENDNVTDYSDIQVTLFSTNGLMATNYCVSRGIATNARSVESITTTDQAGNYIFEDVPEGVYTIYASSNSSKQKAVATNVVVRAAEKATAEDLGLIATGSISGKITIDEKTVDVLGLDVFIAGTSYIAKVASDGTYEISDIPAKTNYMLCVQKGEKTIIIKESLEVKANDVLDAQTKDISSSEWESTAFEWLGSYETEPTNPKKHGAYFNTVDGCSYIWTGEKWDLLAKAGATRNTGSSITWKGSFAQAPENPQLYWAYYNTTDECSYIWTGENWDFISKSGLDGTNGSNGADGSDGTNGEDGTDGEDGIDGIDGLSITWKGMCDIAPENPELNWAYFNNTDGCSYIYNGTSWDLLAQAGRDGANADTSDKYRGLLDLEDFIPEEFILKGNVYTDSKENWVDLPYNKMLPNLGDKITLSFNFISDQDIDLLSIRFADASKAANYWLELLGEEKSWLYIENIKAGEEVNVNHTFTFSERPIDMVRLQVSALVYDFDEAKLTISNSKIKVTSEIGLPAYCLSSTSPKSTNITATDEGIKFSGTLLSNIQDQTAKCTIIIRDTENDVQMERQYSLANSNAYESWEMVYPLVEKDKEYTFEITTKCEATTISFEKVTVTAIGGLGEYKIENIDEYEVTLSDDKKTLTRTPQEFTNNPDVPVIDYATKYDMYSNNDAATSVWDGVWMPSKMCWQSSTNQINDLTKFDETWFTYETLESKVKGRRLGVVTRTFAKIAGYTYNDTTYFLFNDYKETFFNWDEEEQNQFLILYKNPETGEYYEDVPGTNVYYIIGEKDDETGKLVNIKFADKDTEGAIEVYGQLITFGDRIYEPAYVPATEIEDHIFSGTWKAEYSFKNDKIAPLSFPSTLEDGTQGECIPVVYLTPIYKPIRFNIHFVDENGDELLPSIKTTQQKVRIESRPPERTNYNYNYYWKDSLSEDAKEIYPWEDLNLTKYDTYLYAKYELYRIKLQFLNKDGSIFKTREIYDHSFSVNKEDNRIDMTQEYVSTTYEKPVSSEENKVFDHWECETGESFTAGQSISSIGKISDVINFYPVFRDAKVKTVYFNDENGNQILDPIVLTETNSDNWNEFWLPEIPEKSGYISDGYWHEGENAYAQNTLYTFDTAESVKLFTPNYNEPEQFNYSSTYNLKYLYNTMGFAINCSTENSYTVYWADSYSGRDTLETLLKESSLSLDESVDIKVSVYSADGKHIITDTPNDLGPITFVPNINGTYVIKVEPYNSSNYTGWFAIKVEESTSSDDPTNP